jgi:hypothetical protein
MWLEHGTIGHRIAQNARFGPIVLQKSKVAGPRIFREMAYNKIEGE